MKDKPNLITCGYVTIDVNILGGKKTVLPGGSAYFVALAASLITSPIGLVSRIGRDYKNSLLFLRVMKKGIRRMKDKKTPTSTQFYLSPNDLTLRDVHLDWGVAPDISPLDIPQEWLKLPIQVHIATMPPKQQRLFVDFVAKHMKNATVSIDTDVVWLKNAENRKIVRYNFSKCDIIFANRLEYNILKKTVDKAKEAIVKLDKDGAYILRKGMVIERVSTKKVKPIDVTGAGDIFAGTYLAMRSLGETLHACLLQATNTATLSVTKEGVTHLFKS